MVTHNIAALTKQTHSVPVVRVKPLRLEWLAGALLCGTVAGLAAPGMDQSWLAWIVFAPLFLACSLRDKPRESALLGTIYGFAFNLVYLQWYLQVRDGAWTAIFAEAPAVSRVVVWLAMALLQGLFVGATCFLLRKLPLSAGFVPARRGTLPLYLVAPVLWVAVVEKIGNFRGLLGVPWSMLEYTQYNNPAMLQVASIIGGCGLGCAIVFANVVLATMVATVLKTGCWAFESRRAAAANLIPAALLLLAIPLFGDARLSDSASKAPTVRVAALQANLAEPTHKVPTLKCVERGLQLAYASRADICIWPEWSIPIDWSVQRNFVQFFAGEAKLKNQTWILGTFDSAGNPKGREYNSIGIVRSDGTIADKPYHKQYLVPFGEYIPDWVYSSPLMSIFDAKHQLTQGSLSGTDSMVMDAGKAKVGPMICFENCMPEFAAASTRGGAQLLVDCSNTTWFNYSNVLGRQLIAFSVMRAVENHRSSVFCTTLGPSAIIDPNGRILQQAHVDQPIGLEAEVPLESDTTPFTRMCRF